jgi:hypothetical protein
LSMSFNIGFVIAGEAGLEPATQGLTVPCSAN